MTNNLITLMFESERDLNADEISLLLSHLSELLTEATRIITNTENPIVELIEYKKGSDVFTFKIFFENAATQIMDAPMTAIFGISALVLGILNYAIVRSKKKTGKENADLIEALQVQHQRIEMLLTEIAVKSNVIANITIEKNKEIADLKEEATQRLTELEREREVFELKMEHNIKFFKQALAVLARQLQLKNVGVSLPDLNLEQIFSKSDLMKFDEEKKNN